MNIFVLFRVKILNFSLSLLDLPILLLHIFFQFLHLSFVESLK